VNDLICPKCMAIDATVRLDLDDGETLTCDSCVEMFSLADVREMIDGITRAWAVMAAWVETCPARAKAVGAEA